jgi:hypothetical protein
MMEDTRAGGPEDLRKTGLEGGKMKEVLVKARVREHEAIKDG